MAIKDTLQDSKNRLTALLNYANGITGKNDPSLGDAVKTLCDGYGQGGGDPMEAFKLFVYGGLTRLRLEQEFDASLLLMGANQPKTAMQTIESLELPGLTRSTPTWWCGNIRNLRLVDLGFCPSIGNVSFNSCTNLRWLILRKSDSCATLYSGTSLTMHTTGLIFVPPGLIDSYKTASAWSSHAARFRPLYIAQSVAEKNAMLSDASIQPASMIVCDIDATYTLKEE